jgi:Ca2+-binding RTX toxin-like protein
MTLTMLTSGSDLYDGRKSTTALWVNGQEGNDTILGGAFNDTLIGTFGADRLDGGGGHDSLSGGFGQDSLIGGLGNDTLIGGAGTDILVGGGGADLFVFTPASTGWAAAGGGDVIRGFDGLGTGGTQDRIALKGYSPEAHIEFAGYSAANPLLQYYRIYDSADSELASRVDLLTIQVTQADKDAGRLLVAGDYTFA